MSNEAEWPARVMPDTYSIGERNLDIALATQRATDLPCTIAAIAIGALAAMKISPLLGIALSIAAYVALRWPGRQAVKRARAEAQRDTELRLKWLDRPAD